MRLAPRGSGVLLAVTLAAACSAGGETAPTTAGSAALSTSATAAAGSPAASPEVSEMTSTPSSSSAVPFGLTSTAFDEGGSIPREFTCDGLDVSPPLAWTGVPEGTRALVLIVDDPDARGFVHWIVLDLPSADGDLPRGVAPTAPSPQQGRNDFGKAGWGGPCPPSGTHHYRFTLTAVAAPLGLPDGPSGEAVAAALGSSTVIGTVTLTGTYGRS